MFLQRNSSGIGNQKYDMRTGNGRVTLAGYHRRSFGSLVPSSRLSAFVSIVSFVEKIASLVQHVVTDPIEPNRLDWAEISTYFLDVDISLECCEPCSIF